MEILPQEAQEREWLKTKPAQLLTHYQSVVEVVCQQFIARGFFQAGEREELIQEVNLVLLESRLQKIQLHFKGTVKLRTYFSKVVYNSFQELARRRSRQPTMLSEESLQHTPDADLNAYQKMAIQDELFRLEAILKGLGKRQHKALFNLKLLVRFLLEQTDIQFYTSPKTTSVLERIKKSFFQPYDQMTDKEVFDLSVQLYNLLEGKENDGDSLRRWINTLKDRLIHLLNGSPQRSAHTADSIKLLLTYYFSSKKP
ncbi:MAG: hypothetical protein KTR30_12875 [Saprospiraceae bacterium]|nr:hypothetical protein [Saprospiraceae bacterium]